MIFNINYGHTLIGADTGAGGNGRREEVLTRELGRAVTNIFRQYGHIVYECYVDNANTLRESLNVQCRQCDSHKVDFNIPIHFNAAVNPNGNGTEIFTYKCRNIPQARKVLENMNKLGYTNRGIKDGTELALIGSTNDETIYIETCFITNKDDMDRYDTDKVARAICNAFDSNILLEDKPQVQEPSISYQAQIEGIGWQEWKSNGETAGTTGQSKRLEALAMKMNNYDNKKLHFRCHLEGYGWTEDRLGGEVGGSVGDFRRMEAITIKVDGLMVRYRVHVADYGWMDWKYNGEIAGTTGESRRIEAIEIHLYK